MHFYPYYVSSIHKTLIPFHESHEVYDINIRIFWLQWNIYMLDFNIKSNIVEKILKDRN